MEPEVPGCSAAGEGHRQDSNPGPLTTESSRFGGGANTTHPSSAFPQGHLGEPYATLLLS